MLLAVDVGNTDVTFGVFEDKRLVTRFHFSVKPPRTSDEYGVLICDIINQKGISVKSITDVIVSSVVPKIMYSFRRGIVRYIGVDPIIVGAGIRTGLKIMTANPKETGPDRIVDAVAAYELYGGPVIVIDYGTATTYDYVAADGTFCGGAICPGVKISAKALWDDTANLPEIEIMSANNAIAKDTVSAMQAGLFFGTVGQSSYIIKKIKQEAHTQNIRVIATGGLGNLISEHTREIEVYDADLTLKGLQILFEKQKR
ncbi:MAG: type III pantothenate kinase [Lachnospiraceae bacterium]|jgi:type III pantothenate kinase|nr:type III pantothenate kinase [Lachnospiraceae bacterium]MEE3461652.1 type III pantothenate kinase [Lachnospiraceae bacterium]